MSLSWIWIVCSWYGLFSILLRICIIIVPVQIQVYWSIGILGSKTINTIYSHCLDVSVSVHWRGYCKSTGSVKMEEYTYQSNSVWTMNVWTCAGQFCVSRLNIFRRTINSQYAKVYKCSAVLGSAFSFVYIKQFSSTLLSSVAVWL